MTQAFSFVSLQRQIRPRDFADDTLNNTSVLDSLVARAVDQAQHGFNSGISVKQIELDRKLAYTTTMLEEKLVLRKLVSNLLLRVF